MNRKDPNGQQFDPLAVTTMVATRKQCRSCTCKWIQNSTSFKTRFIQSVLNQLSREAFFVFEPPVIAAVAISLVTNQGAGKGRVDLNAICVLGQKFPPGPIARFACCF